MSETPVVAAPFKDRSAGLMVFGIFELLMGACCGLMFPLTLLNAVLMRSLPPGQVPQTDPQALIFGSLFYAVGAAFLITMGIGSIRARRWACTLMLVTSWIGLACGVMGMVLLSTMVPVFRQMVTVGRGDESVATVALAVMAVVGTIVYVLLPGAFVLFYRSPHVRATCEHRDPNLPWTDRCPAPVLAASLLTGFGAIAMLAMPLAYGVVLFFGLHTGWAAYAITLPIGALYAFATFDLYRQRRRGWWMVTIASTLLMVAGTVTFTHLDFAALYEAMGYSREWAERMAPIGESMRWGYLIWGPAWLGFLLWIKRYFRP